MKFNPILLLTTSLLFSLYSSAQVQKSPSADDSRYRLQLRNGPFTPEKNITESSLNELNRTAMKISGSSFTIIQFETIPTEAQRQQLKQAGIELLDYIPNNAYTASVKTSLSVTLLNQLKARAVVKLAPEQKMQPELASGRLPAHAIKVPGTIDVWISFPRTFTYEAISSELTARNIEIITIIWQSYRVIGLRINTDRLSELASLPFIEYVEAAPKEDVLLNNKSIVNDRSNVLQSSLPGGRNLKGEGVTIGIGDDADPLPHIDFANRLINRAAIAGGAHGVHVTGTAAAAGIVVEQFAGHATKATVIQQVTSNILAYSPAYVQDHNMVISNNSYGNVVDNCSLFGTYDLYSRIMDLQMLQMPNLQHIFAVGNSGNPAVFNCSPYPAGMSTVVGGYQTAKNVITVGSTTELGDSVHVSSSKGPARDGRIKPEIVAQGVFVISTFPNYAYGFSSGTSMASPAVAGGLAQLIQRYRQLHAGADPKNGLMKALLCNGATDWGNPGPDYKFGFGQMNLLRSVLMLEQNNYFNTTVNAAGTQMHTITIPAGLAQLKVMLYWNDAPAAVLASHALINDLDLEVTDPGATIHFPLKPDTTAALVNNPATATAADHVNNIEQVVITNPAAGTYTFTIKGTTIPSSPNYEYFLVFDTIPVHTVLTNPIGGEHFQENDSTYINWNSAGNPANNFTAEYSLDNGGSWLPVAPASTAAAAVRRLKWRMPAGIATEQARIKLTHNGTGIVSTSEPFSIMGLPTVSLDATQCEGYIKINWTAVAGISDYEVMMLRGGAVEMTSMGTTTGTTFTISGLTKDSLYFVSVRPRISGVPGRRAIAVSRQPNNGTCAGNISDNDLKIDAIISPARSGRKFTSTELSNAVNITVRIKNLDNVATSGNVQVTYILGTDPPVVETITAPNIAGGATYDHTFTTTADLSAVGTYPLKVSVTYTGDPVVANDTLTKTFKQLDNPFIDITSADFLDNIETAAVQSHTTAQVGLQGLDRYDFVTNTAFGRIRTFVNTGISYSGSKALTLDADRYNAGGTADSLKGTFNLNGYSVSTDDIRLDFMYKHHGQLSNPANRVWIRGSDTDPWIQVYDLYANQTIRGLFRRSSSIELSDILTANGQTFTASFQVRWGQWGQILTSDNRNGAGYTFDDIHLYLAQDDIQMVSLDEPVIASCALTNATPITISIRNSDNSPVTNIPVRFQIDGNSPLNPAEIIPLIGGNTTITYTFIATADLSAPGPHTIRVWSELGTDTYKNNDTVTVVIRNSPVIAAFPYLQNFEADNGLWYTGGTNSSWEYGTPASPKINRAASGSKAWKTSLVGAYNDDEISYLYSPCFDVTGMTSPTLSLSIALDIEDCGGALCDAAYVQYSTDGITWSKLGAVGSGTNWYNRNYAGHHVWSIQNYTRWHVATIPLPTGVSRLRLRFVMESDPFVSLEGIAVDDIHIYDNTMGIYTGAPFTSASVNQPTVNGSSWIDFTDGGRLIASVNPNGQNLGSTDAQVFIHTGAARVNFSQYYHNRNITIKPTNVALADSATVRFYFLDSETEALINATGCSGCSKPSTAYQLGVSKYSDPNDAYENGVLGDDMNGNWLFINAQRAVKVPFDRGYYAEFKVKDFSEFWLNNGGTSGNQTLPSELISFTAKKKQYNNDVLVEWTTASENNVTRYEVEVARSNAEYSQNQFSKLGEIASNGNTTTEQHYEFTDIENNKAGVRYYRLKTIDIDGRSVYSIIRPVVFDEEIKWQVYPNPSGGLFNFVYQATAGETVQLRVFDINGKQIQLARAISTGFVQKSEIDLRGSRFAAGLYLLEITSDKKKETFRLIKR